ncbi:hypothetical protein H7K45_25125 [Mycobacterium yunnanensis]|uniref:Secreted protein n=1 Tax=Mycobacterium yunnanensis TaxID=368477 RepID=A0A9X2Z7Q9_9MYCO|nr:hypothetical protein [Mycobacterium yunnanensis]MCV7423841.1 hypothetical protein [Mycobacterium yunnanensis]
MTIARVLAVAAMLVTSALGFAGHASADQVMEGVYGYDQGDVHAEWTIYPSCVPTVGDLRDNLELPVACRLHVAPNSPRVNGGDARLTGGLWTFSTTVKEGFPCPDGNGFAPVVESYQFDDATMSGKRSTANSAACNGTVQPKIVVSPFTLAFSRPLPIPVDRYPLYCEPGGLKRCF